MMLQIQSLIAGYGGGPVLHGIDLELRQGEIVTLIGANGAGKSTLVQCISGLRRPTAGRIMFEGAAIDARSPAERLRLGIAHVPEGRQVFATMTVAENLALGSHAVGGDTAARLQDVCTTFPILDQRRDEMVGNFSGGQQQMLAIGRGLMSGPRLLLLDEPSLGLSPLLVGEVFRLICQLRDKGITILLAEQNARSALSIADRGYVVENGRITLSGDAHMLLSSPDVLARYLGGTSVAQSGSTGSDLAARLRACIAAD